MTTYFSVMNSPIGELLLASDGEYITQLAMDGQKYFGGQQADWQRDDAIFQDVCDQLDAYFAGQLQVFDVPLAPVGTDFQQIVWRALREIPFGDTWNYGELAQHIGKPKAARAVGMANGHNPISIIVPCHRVIGANGKLTGYGGGIWRKRWLLQHEGAHFVD